MAAAKILVVDDDKNLLELARARLEGAGYAVLTAPGDEPGLAPPRMKLRSGHWGSPLADQNA